MEESSKALSEALSAVKVQRVQLKRFLDTDQVMDALKSTSTMTGELRSSVLAPKHYYELYMAVFDSLRHLSMYLYDAHTSGKHHLADVYELVQYCGNIVPRLYLMITVGSVYMSIPDAPVKEIMKDMLEMSRGVQHPTRGLFLRHYLSGTTRDYLPVGDKPGPGGELADSISFVLTNFVEMNKLWVRQQHQGHSRDREKREMERRELRILVGTNFVRLSQLDGVTLDLYSRTILPRILEQVINCKDVIAQEYLMEVIIQVFPDDFHIHTLGPFLSACARLHPRVNIKNIVIALINRLAAFAAREADDSPEELRRREEEAGRRLAERLHALRLAGKPTSSVWQEINEGALEQAADPVPVSGAPTPGAQPKADEGPSPADEAADVWAREDPHPSDVQPGAETQMEERPAEPQEPAQEERPREKPEEEPKEAQAVADASEGEVRRFRGIPENVRLFEVFWEQIVLLMHARPDLSSQDISALILALLNLSLSCYPDRLEYVDQMLAFAHERFGTAPQSSDPHQRGTAGNLHELLLAPVHAYASAFTLLALPSYVPLLAEQPYNTQRSVAQAVALSVLKKEAVFTTPEEVQGVLDLCMPLIREPREGEMPLVGAAEGMMRSHAYGQARAYPGAAPTSLMDEMMEEQGWLARIVHLFRARDPEVQLSLLQTARRYFVQGGERIRATLPPLITEAVRLTRLYKQRQYVEPDWERKVNTLLHFVHQLISTLYHRVEASDLCLRLYLLAAEAADECGREELAYEFYVQSFTIYEESISESRAQLQAIGLIIATLFRARIFDADTYDTLITKAALHGAKLLKKPHQAAAVMMASHLWWQTESGKDAVEKPQHALVRDGKRVLECLQKALRIANGCIDERVKVDIFSSALDKYLYYYEQEVEAVTAKYINSLIELITNGLLTVEAEQADPANAPMGVADAKSQLDATRHHFLNQLHYIKQKKRQALGQLAQEKPNGESHGPDWNSIELNMSLNKLGVTP